MVKPGKREPLQGEVTGIISMFDVEGTNYEVYRAHGPACLTLDQLTDARREARKKGDEDAWWALSRHRDVRLRRMQATIRTIRRGGGRS